MTRLHIFRHGETEWNVLGRMHGRQDSPLTSLGREQALAARDRLKGEVIRAAYCSSAGRAVETTALLLGGGNTPIRAMDELGEIHLGAWEGMKHEGVRDQYPDEYRAFWDSPGTYRSVGGETFHELQNRAVPAIREILADNHGHTALLVSHAALIKTALAFFDGRSMDEIWKPPRVENLSHSIIEETEPGLCRIVMYAGLCKFRGILKGTDTTMQRDKDRM